MATFIITALAVLALLVAVGAAVMFSYFSGLAGAAVTGRVLQTSGYGPQEPAPELSPQALRDLAEAARLEALLRDLDCPTR